ncbi:hypothetical protein [Pseudoxanthomonas japonensis]|uniref:hypothetical protein n=1 Tax=Pseudoxanthomonas japonensis TaxID=69284 RepID=UPI0037493779
MTQDLPKDEYLAIVGTSRTSRPVISTTGIWSRIVCPPCEASFGPDDEYLITAIRGLEAYPTSFEGQVTALHDVDPFRLKRSLLSILMRGHLSDHRMYSTVDIGPYAEVIRRHLRNEQEDPKEVAVFLRHITGPLGGITTAPIRERWEGVNAYRLFFPNLTAMIKLDRRPFPSPFPLIQLGATDPPLALRFQNPTPSERNLIYRIADSHKEHLRKIMGKFSGRYEGLTGGDA